MKQVTWLMRGLAAFLAWTGVGLGLAEAQVIYPVISTTPPFALNTSSTVTVSIFQNGVNITNAWLPEPGQTVQIVVNGLATPTISLVCPDGSLNTTASCSSGSASTSNPLAALPPVLRTSAYPGQCTNFDNPSLALYASDFQLSVNKLSGNNLTSTDCGGMAVIQVTGGGSTLTFALPQDSNFNGIPDVWEATFCPGNACPTGKEDGDVGASGAPLGDGIAAFDEYRGFIVSAKHIRTDPRQKDVFVHLVNPQCGNSPSLLPTYFPDGLSLFANANSLISGSQVHILGLATNPFGANSTTTEWVDNLQSYSVATGFVYVVGTDGAVSDRRINKNAVYPLVDTVTGTAIQKGLRVTECLDTSVTSPLGLATPGTPNGPDNAIIFTQRIVNSVTSLVTAGATRQLRYSTFVNGSWVTSSTAACPQCGPVGSAGVAPSANDISFMIGKAIQFYLAMEIGHAVSLTPTFSTTYGYHDAPFTGDNLDQAITTKIDKSTSGFNTFYIPSLYLGTDLSSFKLKN